MRKETKKQTLIALAAGLAVVVTGAAMTRQNVSANEPEAQSATFSMIRGASVRLDSEHYGLRFAAEIPSEPQENETYHMVIFPASYVDKYDLTNESDFVATLDEKESDGAKYIDMPCLVYSPTKTEDCFEAGKHYIRGSVTSIQYSHIDGDFFGIAYKSTAEANGNVSREYASYTEGENVRDIVRVASALLYNDDYEEGTDEYNILTKIFNQAVNLSNNVAAENKDEAHAAFDLPTSYSIALGETKQFNPTNLTDVLYAWSSEDETVATVAQDGTVTAKKVGATKITYKIAHETVTCDVAVTSEHRLDSTDKIAFKSDNMNVSVVDAGEASIGLPQDVDDTNKNVLKAVFKKQEDENTAFPTFDISSVVEQLDEIKTKYISLKMYTKTLSFWTGDSNVYLTNQADGSGATKAITGAMHIFEDSTNAGWVEVRIPVSRINAVYESGYNYIQLGCWRAKAVVSEPFYFHSWELKEMPTSGRFDDKQLVDYVPNSNISGKSVVSAAAEGIGLPKGETGDEVVKIGISAGNTTVKLFFNIVGVLDRLDEYQVHDYLSIKLYSKQTFWTNGTMYLNSASGEANKVKLPLTEKIHSFEDTTSGAYGWLEIKVPVSVLKSAYASNTANSTLFMECWRNDGNIQPFYLHSWGIVHATNVRFDTVESIMNANWSKAIVDATDESVGIGLPQDVTGNEVLKLSTTETGGGSVFPVFYIGAVTCDLNKISNNAYISLRLYTKSTFYYSAGQIFLANSKSGGGKKGLEGCSIEWEEDSTSMGWLELKIPASSIKTAYASGYDFIYMDLWKGDRSDPFYFHSWSLVTAD